MNDKTKKLTPIKEMIILYLAISKIMYWLGVVGSVGAFEEVGVAMINRFLSRDAVLIISIVFIYFLDDRLVTKQQQRSKSLGIVTLFIGGYLAFCGVLIVYLGTLSMIFSQPANFIANIFTWTPGFFIIMVILVVKENVKEKAKDLEKKKMITCTDNQLEVLKTLLDDGRITEDEFNNIVKRT